MSEGTDAFVAGVEIGDDDPFLNTDFGDFSDDKPTEVQPEPPDDVPSVDADIPIVNAEGEHISPEAAEAARKAMEAVERERAEQAAAEAAMAANPIEPVDGHDLANAIAATTSLEPAAEAPAPAQAPVDPTPAVDGGTTGSITEPAERFNPVSQTMEAPAPAPVELGGAMMKPDRVPTQVPEALRVPVGEAAVIEEEEEAAVPEVETAPPPPPPPAEPPAPPTAPEGIAALEVPENPDHAPEPEELKNNAGKVVKRRYVVLQVDGPGKFSQIAWHVDKAGKIVAKGTPGARRQTVALARGTDEALKIGYAAVGSPAKGVTLIACAQLHFQPRKIEPIEPEPEKQRLKIT
jgi:hypothetical protein